ncbi:hypothetical protein F2P56_005142 [Juglans regia]|uniref:(-)-germacrene D synthase-like n=2 Tax=Juglans regia TaxID=51240 RepID=A0A834D2A5_JUGRE|nr:(-)-germacrene D synthase-like [Juglans regia]KAF5478599.1 hypothetical protein F2P56_005142 [Juglans regia]
MSFPISAVPSSTQIEASGKLVGRNLAHFSPSVWGSHFLSYASDSNVLDADDDHKIMQQVQELKDEVKRMLIISPGSTDQTLSEKLDLIDAIQHLGVSYHFESEIDEILQKAHKINPPCFNNINIMDHAADDQLKLYTISLWFRLLRQQGYDVSCDIFNEFKDDKGSFKASLISDVKGMLSLYEAAHLGINGEDILDEALAFTTTHLELAVNHIRPQLAKKVKHALNRPIRKALPRLEGLYYISIYKEEDSYSETLLKFAKLDFNVLQSQHQKEIGGITRCWKNLDFTANLPYARDRIVEGYFWTMGVFFEPQYSLARRIMTKVIGMTSILDDTYDAYGSYAELKLFTEAIERWDVSAIDILPEYMKLIYKALLDVYDEIEAETAKDGRPFCVHYAKESMKKLIQAYFIEAKWCNEGYAPTMEEYMSNAMTTSAYQMLAPTSFLGMGNIADEEVFKWVFNDPKILRASTIICRLMDDIKSHKFEQSRAHAVSAVECYMKQYGVSAEEEVYKLLGKEIVNAWKDINEELLMNRTADHHVPMPILERVLNLARVIDLVYEDGDAYTDSNMMKDYIASLLVNPLVLQ